MNKSSSCSQIILLVFILLYFQHISYSQNESDFSSEQIQNLIDLDSLNKAEALLKNQEKFYLDTKQYDSLSNLVYFHGRIAKLKGEVEFIKKSEKALQQLKSLTNNPDALYNAYSDMAALTIENGMEQSSYDYNKLGLEAAEKTTVDRLNKMSNRTYGLASTSYFMRKFDLVKKHGLETFNINEKNPDASPTSIYNACNILGVMLENENKLDSALHYYNKGVKALKKSEGSLSERYYYPAILSGNIAVIYLNKGQFHKSLKNQEAAIHNYKIYIDSSSNSPKLNNIRYNYLATINDMGSNYVKLGQIERALQIFEYNYKKAQEYFPKNSIQQIIFTNQLAQGKWVAHENEEALKLINESFETLKGLSADYAGYMTYDLGTKANILENFDRIEEAYNAYKSCDSLYEVVSSGKYSFDRLTKLREAAMFYSRNGFDKEANEASQRVIDVASEKETTDNLGKIKAYNLMAGVKFNLKDYKSSIDWSEKSLNTIEKNRKLTNMDSIFWHELKIESVYRKSKAQYKLIDTNHVASVFKIYQTLKLAVTELNTNASKYESDLDKNQYLYKTHGFLDFVMNIALRLYSLTNDNVYLDHLISMHESRIYNRIRSKLAIREDIQFKGVPKSVLKREKQLKESLAKMRSETDFDNKIAENFTLKNKEWNSFLDSLKTNFPKYYKFRYQILKQSLGNVQSQLPENTTVVRYLFIEENLYAFVINSEKTALHKLNANNILNQINTLSGNIDSGAEINTLLFEVYKQLWKPLENEITTKKVIIVPDQKLFNLSFETLTTKKVNNINDLARHSLLSKYIISYNYSLYLLDKDRKAKYYSENFIGFAPEFNSKMKSDYQLAITDPISMDKTYLTLLRQPFSKKLAEKSSKIFDGSFFVNNQASKQIFTQEAKEHKIIHIGTHAESNNVSPELSRLIFAKNINDTISSEDNSLYTYEIYNQNLSSNLAILTACETGKPTYQAGEGMISLAHAFNYAGSESILTSLWQIDEQSSVKIIENFYQYLKDGLPKDEALRNAKLDYIATAKGRTTSPQYWAGLVLIGDTTSIKFSTESSNTIYWVIAALLSVLLIFFIYKKQTK